jgi:hypothetical protein
MDKQKTCKLCGTTGPTKNFHGLKCSSCKAADTRAATAKKRQTIPPKERGYSFETAQAYIEKKTTDFNNGAPGWGAKPRPTWFPNEEQHALAVAFWKSVYQQGDAFQTSSANQKKRWASGELKKARIDSGTYLDSRRCEFPKCPTTASFGFNGKRQCCDEHKRPGMEHCSTTQCLHPGCEKQPSYGLPGCPPQYCALHGKKVDGYIDVVTAKCQVDGCYTGASWGPEGSEKRQFCAHHGRERGLANVIHVCMEEGCEGTAHFGYEDGSRIYCKDHAEPGMLNKHQRICQDEECREPAAYGTPGGSPQWCGRHKIWHDSLMFHPTAKCETCSEIASYGSWKNPKRCDAHKLDDDIHLIERSCVICKMTHVLSPTTNKCEHCDSNWTLGNAHQHERDVKYLLDAFDIRYTQDRQYSDGTLRRPDFVLHLSTEIDIVLEVDERNHRDYDDEVERMKEIEQQASGPVVFIRYNPESQDDLDEKHDVIIKAINTAKTQTSSQVVYLFYDKFETGEFHPLDPMQLNESRKCCVCKEKKSPKDFPFTGSRKCSICSDQGNTNRLGSSQNGICVRENCPFAGKEQSITEFPISKGTSRSTICRACKRSDSQAHMAKKRKLNRQEYTLETLHEWIDTCEKHGWGKRRPHKKKFDSNETYAQASRIWEMRHMESN